MKSSTLGLQLLVNLGHEVHDTIPLTGDHACVEEGEEEWRIERGGRQHGMVPPGGDDGCWRSDLWH
jgi:hypothetical protein